MEQTGKVSSPPKKRKRSNLYTKFSEDEKKAVRYVVHRFFKNNEIPTLNKVLQAIHENEHIPPVSRASLHRILKKLGFVWEKRSRNSLMLERTDIILRRRRYLDKILEFRQKERIIYYLDETWVNAGHTKQKIWKDKTVTNARQAFVEDLSAGLKNPAGKGGRFIIAHIGNENGFVENGLLIFESKKSGDYHEDMNSNVFEEWLERILPSLSENCIIVMDNALYHSVKTEKTPTTAWKKEDIIAYLEKKGIEVNHCSLKVELLEVVKNYLKTHPVPYKVDELVRSTQREVLRLPPYHCNLNPIELIWSQVKGYVAANNKTFKLSDVRRLFYEGLSQVTAEKWSSCVQHIMKEEKELYTLDNNMENFQVKFTVNTGSSSEDESSGSD